MKNQKKTTKCVCCEKYPNCDLCRTTCKSSPGPKETTKEMPYNCYHTPQHETLGACMESDEDESTPESVEDWEKDFTLWFGQNDKPLLEFQSRETKDIVQYFKSLLAQEREKQKRKDAAKVWLWHKEHCDCEEIPLLGYDAWHSNAEKLRQSILPDNNT